MKKIQIFDPALCCSSGVCGTEVDQQLVDFSANVHWALQQGLTIERFNLAQQPMDFAESAAVKGLLQRSGGTALPITLVDGELALAGRYPSRADLARWLGVAADASAPSTETCSPSDSNANTIQRNADHSDQAITTDPKKSDGSSCCAGTGSCA